MEIDQTIHGLQKHCVELEARVSYLETIIKRLALSGPENTVALRAPLAVVDTRGQKVLEINADPDQAGNPCTLRLFSPSGGAGAAIGVDGSGGYLAIRDSEGELVAYVSVESGGGKFQVLRGGSEGGVVIYVDDTDGGGINVLHCSGGMSATLHSDTHGGALEIYSGAQDSPVAILTAAEDGAQFELHDPKTQS